jgi:type II protein arginine methyltransferase
MADPQFTTPAEAARLLAAGDMPAARAAYVLLAEREPVDAEACHMAGVLSYQLGDATAALAWLDRAVAAAPRRADYANNLGVVLRASGRAEAAVGAFEAALRAMPGYSDAWSNLGAVHRDLGRLDEAVRCYRKALEADPANSQALHNLKVAYSDAVPTWHFAMMNDHARNDAYDQALRRFAPGRRVLDIGTGAGLLAMMAARAGAASVTTCEMVGFIAERARLIIDSNGLADRIDILAKRSTDIVVGSDLAEPAELLVTETFSSGLLGEHALPTIEDARLRLLAPGARIIPQGAVARGYLAGGDDLFRQLSVSHASGFDLAAFDLFAPPRVGMHVDTLPHEPLSADTDLIAFDLRRPAFPAETREVIVTVNRPGRAVAIVQWLSLDVAEGITYENRPRGRHWSCGWTHILYRLPTPMMVAPGDRLRFDVRHNRTNLDVTYLGRG